MFLTLTAIEAGDTCLVAMLCRHLTLQTSATIAVSEPRLIARADPVP
jgi:hypothetical protein